MAKCQRQFGNELLSSSTTASKRDLGPVSRKFPLKLRSQVYLKPGIRKKKKLTTPYAKSSEVLVIWVRRLSELSFSSVCTSFLNLITKLRSHSAWVSSGFLVLVLQANPTGARYVSQYFAPNTPLRSTMSGSGDIQLRQQSMVTWQISSDMGCHGFVRKTNKQKNSNIRSNSKKRAILMIPE